MANLKEITRENEALRRRVSQRKPGESLIRQLWHGPDSGDPDKVRTFVKQLRRKLGDDPAQPVYIQNVRAVGYRMAEPQPLYANTT